MTMHSALATARLMIPRYGMEAQAIALARAVEGRQRHDPAAQDYWEEVYATISELRRTAALHRDQG